MTVESKRSSGSEDRGRKAPFFFGLVHVYTFAIYMVRGPGFFIQEPRPDPTRPDPNRTEPNRTEPNRTEPKKKTEPEGLTMMLDDVT
jgi:hypothetical protein